MGRGAPSIPASSFVEVPNLSVIVPNLPVIVPSSAPSVASPYSDESPSPASASKYLMNDIPRGTSLPKLIKCLQPPGYGQTSPASTLHDVQVGVIIQDSRLDDELSVATIEFHDNPTWLSQDPCGFPKFTPLGTLWRAIDRNAVDSHGRTEFIRAVMDLDGGTRMGLCYAEMLAEFTDTDVNIQDHTGRTALHWACAASHLHMVMLCLSVPDCRIGLKDNDGLTAFDIASRNTNGNEAIPLLFYHSMIDMDDVQPQAALLRALTITSEPDTEKAVFPGAAMFTPVEDGNEPLVEALICRGVDLTATNEHRDTALHLAAAKADNVAITTRLLNAGSDVNAIGNQGATPLHYAVGTADVEMVKLLLHHEADRSAKDHRERTALQFAEEGRKQDLEVLLTESTTDTRVVLETKVKTGDDIPLEQEAADSRGVLDLTPVKQPVVQVPLSQIELIKVVSKSLLQAAADNDLDIVRLHLRMGTDLEGRDSKSNTALHIATAKGYTTIVETLLTGGAQIQALGDCGYTALHDAAEKGHTESVKALIAAGALLDARSEAGETALHKAAAKGCIEVVEALLASGANMEARSSSNKTALHKAARGGCTGIVEILIARGANIEALSKSNETALHLAAQGGHTAVVDLLIAWGLNMETQCLSKGQTALHVAASQGSTETVIALLDGGANKEALSKSNETALHMAAKGGHTAVVEVLIARGVNIETQCRSEGRTALHAAASQGHTEAVIALVDGGANNEALSKSDETALHEAARRGHTGIVDILIASGAYMEALSMSNETALQQAISNGHGETVKALRAAGAHSSPADHYRYGVLRLRRTGK